MIALAPPHPKQLPNYASWLDRVGVPYRILSDGETLEKYSMLVLCGGPDVGKAGRRDAQEASWLAQARAAGMPVLGICRGMQLTNACLGGTLHEDVDPAHTADQATSESRWHGVVLDGRTVRVNSRHHQGVDRLAPGLRSLATGGTDGVCEMADGEGILLVQWHPEREDVRGTEAESIVTEWVRGNHE